MERAGEVEKYGLDHAVRQADELIRNGVEGLHIYCMNRSEPVRAILGAVSIPRGKAEESGVAEAGRIRS
jgi:5,10-methylenetetrahydrofolate reductase